MHDLPKTVINGVRFGQGLAVAAPLGIAGCAAPEREVGLGASFTSDADGAYSLKPGDLAPDFPFFDADGKLTRFSTVRGRVTLIAFPNNPDAWPNPDIYRPCAEIAQQMSRPGIPVVVVNIGQPRRSWQDAAAVLSTATVKSNRLVMVADPDGSIRRLFGPNAAGRLYVVDDSGRIRAVSDFRGPDSLRAPAEEVVSVVAGDAYFDGD